MDEQQLEPTAVEIDPERLTPKALGALIEEFILREGTDYGLQEVSLADKRAQLRNQLHRGDIKIFFDLVNESCTLVPAR